MSEEKQLAKVYHFDSYWKRQEKYDRLSNTDFDQVSWEELNPTQPYYFFVPKDFEAMEKYDKWFSVSEIFVINSNWIETHKDWIMIQFTKKQIEEIKQNFEKLSEEEIKQKYKIEKEWSEWKVRFAKKDISNTKIVKILYRPFDVRYTLYSPNSKWVLARPRHNVMKHFLNYNIWLLVKRQTKQDFSYSFCCNTILEACVFESAYAKTQVFPLYLYNQDNLNQTEEKIANFNMETIAKIEEKLAIKYLWIDRDPETSSGWHGSEWQNWFTAQDLFDYIYAVLHSKSYREKFQEFLKIDFPKIPFDVDKQTFFEMVKLGWELRKYHLMEHQDIKPQNYFTSYPIEWNNLVDKIKYKDNKVFINENQYFENVAKEVWEFYIWGYQPAQKWLKDRKWRTLNSDDIEHYIKITFVLKKTIELMEEIEKVFKI